MGAGLPSIFTAVWWARVHFYCYLVDPSYTLSMAYRWVWGCHTFFQSFMGRPCYILNTVYRGWVCGWIVGLDGWTDLTRILPSALSAQHPSACALHRCQKNQPRAPHSLLRPQFPPAALRGRPTAADDAQGPAEGALPAAPADLARGAAGGRGAARAAGAAPRGLRGHPETNLLHGAGFPTNATRINHHT